MSEQKIYGENAIGNPNQKLIGVPGSTTSGAPIYSTDPAILQNSYFANGSTSMIGNAGGQLVNPIQETENTPAFLMSSNIQHAQRSGTLLPWDSTVTYNQYAPVLAPNGIEVYYSRVDENFNNILTDNAYWKFCGDLKNLLPATTSAAGVVQLAPGSTSNVVPDINILTAYKNPTELGEIRTFKYFTGNTVPTIQTFSNGVKAYLFNGQTLTQANAPVLFADRGWTGSVVLENRNGIVSIGMGTGYNIGTTGGKATHTLTINEIPPHQHQYSRQIAYVSFGQTSRYTSPTSDQTQETSQVGGGQPHNNMQPYIVDAIYLLAW